MNQRFPPRRSRPRSPTAKALEIVRLTKRPKASSGGWRLEVRSPRSSILPANATPPSGDPTWPRLMAPGARSEAMGAEIPAAGVPEPTDLTDAPVSTPRPPGSVPLPPSTPYREGLS